MNTLAPNTFQGLHPEEVALFRTHLKGVTGMGVEIGCLDGYSSRVILEASGLHLTSIDPFIPDSMEPSLIGSAARYMANVEQFSPRCALWPMYSHDAAPRWKREEAPLDFLFIDGDHRYDAVVEDFTDWTPILKTGGILALHDARMNRPGGAPFHQGPSQVADELIFGRPEDWEVIGEAFSLVIARKR